MKRVLPYTALAFAAGVYMVIYKVNFIFCLVFASVMLSVFIIARNRFAGRMLAVSLVLVCTFMYADIKLDTAPALPDENESHISGRVTDVSYDSDTASLYVDTENYGTVLLSVYNISPQNRKFIYGDIISAKARLHRSADTAHQSYSRHLLSRHIYIYGSAVLSDITVSKNKTDKSNIFDIAQSVRTKTNEILAEYLPDSVAAMASAILLGDKSNLDDATVEAFSKSGISHVMAVSGMHLNILLGIAMGFFGMLHIKKRLPVMIFYLLLIWFFVLVTGCSASVIRSAIMCTLVFVSLAVRREADSLSSLSLAVIIMMLVNPFTVFDIGFQLSVLSTASIIIFAQPLSRRLPLLSPVKELISVTLSAQIGILPLCALYFTDISLISPVTNLLVAPLSTLVMLLCLLLCLFSFVPFIAGGTAVLLTGALTVFKYIALWLSALPFATLPAVYPGLPVVLLYLALCIALYLFLKKQTTGAFCVFSLSSSVFCVIIVIGILVSKPQLHFIDVGNGDAFLAKDTGVTLLFDGGGSDSYDVANRTLVPYFRQQGVNEIDAAFLTHYHTDHARACLSLINEGYIKTLVLSGSTTDENQQSLLDEILTAAKNRNIDIITVHEGDMVKIDNFYVSVLMTSGENTLYKLSCGGVSTLVTGDMTKDEEQELVYSDADLSCDILKVAHHGSDTSSSDELIDAADPSAAVITVGKNNYGHPSDNVLKRFAQRGIAVYRSDTNGNIVFYLDKDRINHLSLQRSSD